MEQQTVYLPKEYMQLKEMYDLRGTPTARSRATDPAGNARVPVVWPVYPFARKKVAPKATRSSKNEREIAPRTSFTGTPTKPSPSGFAFTYSNSAFACKRKGSRLAVATASQIVRGASGTGCPVSVCRESA